MPSCQGRAVQEVSKSRSCVYFRTAVSYLMYYELLLNRIMALHCLRRLCTGDVALTRTPKPNRLKHTVTRVSSQVATFVTR